MDDGMNGAGSGRPAGVGGTGKSVRFTGESPRPAPTDQAPMPRGTGDSTVKAPGGKFPSPPNS